MKLHSRLLVTFFLFFVFSQTIAQETSNKGEQRWAIGLAFRSAGIPFDAEEDKTT